MLPPPPPPSSSLAAPPASNLLVRTDSSTTAPGTDAGTDPSLPRGTEGTATPGCANPGPGPEDSCEDDFVLDSGAAEHTTARADLLSDPGPPDEGTVLRTRVGGVLPVVAVGCLRRPRFVVPRVHHAPGLKTGFAAVISVRQLARRGLAVTFGSESCSVKEQSTGALVGEGRLREEDGFYHLDYLRIPQN